MLRRTQIKALRDDLLDLHRRIAAGELTATPSTIHRIEGAVAALGAVLGDLEATPDKLLRSPTDSK
jgi:hypothetical protein